MFGIGGYEIIFVFILVLLIFGPKKLPEVGKALGKTLHLFKEASLEVKKSMAEANLQEDLKDFKEAKNLIEKPLLTPYEDFGTPDDVEIMNSQPQESESENQSIVPPLEEDSETEISEDNASKLESDLKPEKPASG